MVEKEAPTPVTEVSVIDVGKSATRSAIKVAAGNTDVGEESNSAIEVSAVDVGRSETRFAIRVEIAPVPAGEGNADVGELARHSRLYDLV